MADVTLTYNGQNILEMSATGRKTLKTAKKRCKTDIEVAYVKSGGGYNILKGTSLPSATIGQDGDVYLQYFELPSGYSLLKYVQSDGSQWVDTGYMPSQVTSAVIKFNPQYVGESAVFGAEWSMNGFLLSFYNSKLRWHSSSYADCPAEVNHEYLVRVSNTSMVVDGTVFPVNAGTVSQYAIRVFLPTNDHDNGRKGRYKLYYFQIFEADTLVMQLIPARRDSDSVVGLYDTVNNNFHVSGVGTLAAGPDAIDGEIVNTYVKVNGAWQELVGSKITDVGATS